MVDLTKLSLELEELKRINRLLLADLHEIQAEQLEHPTKELDQEYIKIERTRRKIVNGIAQIMPK